MNITLQSKNPPVGLRERSAIKSTCWVCKGPGFRFYHPHGSSQLPIPPVSGDLIPSCGLKCSRHSHAVHTCILAFTHIHKAKQIVFKKRTAGKCWTTYKVYNIKWWLSDKSYMGFYSVHSSTFTALKPGQTLRRNKSSSRWLDYRKQWHLLKKIQ